MPSATWLSKFKSNLLSSLYKGRYFTPLRGYASLIRYRIQHGFCNNYHRILLASSLYKARTFQIAHAANLALCSGTFAFLCRKNYLAGAEGLPLTRNNASSLRAQNGNKLLFTRLILKVFFFSTILKVFECAKLMARAFHLVILFSPCIAMAQFADVLGPQFRKMWIRVVRWTLESAGPVFIKWGQWAASRPDSFPRDLRAELSKLHSKAPEHNSAYSVKAIEGAFNCKLTEMYDGFNKHKTPFIWSKDQAHESGDEVDLEREADNLSRFNYNFRRRKHVSFPKRVNVRPDVLVETFEEGKSLTNYVDGFKGRDQRIKSALAHTLGKVDNFFHADLHILVVVPQQKSSWKRIFKSKKPHVVFLDVGMAAELSQNENRNLVDFLTAVARRDGSTAAKCTLNFSKMQNCPNPDAFIKEMKEFFDFLGTPEGDLVPPVDCVMQLLEQVRRHKVNIDSNVCTAILTTLNLEGLLRKLDRKYDMMHTLKTLLLKQNLSDTIVKQL
ncbi:hypothetical protein CQW23_02630 [Capsicum baccatum]|uniref:ABC1 atypical kinase-like domain-containing protein n=1 Tax=Capsicum baccatum TaxID=33114 RepID=A0A2G2XRZ4_CAPBA|nr:hypothetical protein CQW23_02630 [Capsicum baccatum]